VVSNESHVMALLEEGNPAPGLADDISTDVDAATYLATLEQRISEMTKLETNESQQDTPRQWNRPWVMAAAFVLVIGVGVVMFNQMNPAPVAGPPEIPLEGADDHPGAAEAFAAVEAAYAMLNAGDPAFAEIRVEEVEIAGYQTYLASVEPRIDVSGCQARGSGEWPGEWSGVSDLGPVAGHFFICEGMETNVLAAIAGLAAPSTLHWVVDDGAVVAVSEVGGGAFVGGDAFNDAFEDWLATAHPEASGLARLFGDGDLVDEEAKADLLAYAEEFVAQSDVYPLDSPAS
jgi:hypothetical protein